MTRREFIEDVNYWGELIDFCSDECIDLCDDIYDDEDKNDYIDEHLDEVCEGSSWQDVLGVLSDIPTGCDYYIIESVYDMRPVYDDDFTRRKQDVLDYMDDQGYWDDEEEEEVIDEPSFVDTPDEFEVDTTVSLGDFFASSAEDLNKINASAKNDEVKADADFDKFVRRATTVGDYC